MPLLVIYCYTINSLKTEQFKTRSIYYLIIYLVQEFKRGLTGWLQLKGPHEVQPWSVLARVTVI